MLTGLQENPIVSFEYTIREMSSVTPWTLYDICLEFADGTVLQFKDCPRMEFASPHETMGDRVAAMIQSPPEPQFGVFDKILRA